MPLLAVQVDKTFISINLYDHNNLVCTRFASIAPEDYGNSDDYVFEAVQENIDRMLQFYRVTSADRPIEHIIFYGDTKDYIRYVKVMDEDYGIQTSTITAPPNIHGYENLEFAQYVNAIGALFSRDKSKEWVNLLEVDTVNTAKLKGPKMFTVAYLGVMTVLILGLGAVSFLTFKEKADTKDEIEKLASDIKEAEQSGEMPDVDYFDSLIGTIGIYSTGVENAKTAYETYPLLTSDVYKEINEIILRTADECGLVPDPTGDKIKLDTFESDTAFGPEPTPIVPAGSRCVISSPTFDNGTISFSIDAWEPISNGELGEGYGDPALFPKTLSRNFWASTLFTNPDYLGYDVEYEVTETDSKERKVSFEFTFELIQSVPEELQHNIPEELPESLKKYYPEKAGATGEEVES
jgi:hypothetical protein